MNTTMSMEEFLSGLSEDFSAEDLIFSSIVSSLAATITSVRIEKKLTQKEFAGMLDKSQAMISKWENADCNFTLKTLIEVAQKLDLQLNVELKRKPPSSAVADSEANPKILKFPGYYSSPDQVWKKSSSSDEELKEM